MLKRFVLATRVALYLLTMMLIISVSSNATQIMFAIMMLCIDIILTLIVRVEVILRYFDELEQRLLSNKVYQALELLVPYIIIITLLLVW